MSPRLCIGIGGKETKRDRTVGRGRMVAACYLSPSFPSFPLLLLLLASIVSLPFHQFSIVYLLDIILLSSLFFLLN